jgi:hypothetical protein
VGAVKASKLRLSILQWASGEFEPHHQRLHYVVRGEKGALSLGNFPWMLTLWPGLQPKSPPARTHACGHGQLCLVSRQTGHIAGPTRKQLITRKPGCAQTLTLHSTLQAHTAPPIRSPNPPQDVDQASTLQVRIFSASERCQPSYTVPRMCSGCQESHRGGPHNGGNKSRVTTPYESR